VALGIAALSIQLPRKHLSKARLTAVLSSTPDLRQLATRLAKRQVDGDRLASFQQLPKDEQRLLMLTQAALRPLLIGLACDEALALLGAIYAVVAMNIVAGFPIMLLAFVLNGWHFPRLAKLIERGRKLAPDDELDDFDKSLREIEQGLETRVRRQPRPKR
jgi:hypothetical protein